MGKVCQSIYLLRDIFVKKVKMLKESKFDLGKLHGEHSCSGKLLGMTQVLELSELMDMSHQSKICLKFRLLMLILKFYL